MSTNILVRDFTVDLTLVGMAAIHATGRVFHGSQEVVAAMPRAVTPKGKLTFFQIRPRLRTYTPALELWTEAEKLRVVLVDPHTLASFVSANQEFGGTKSVVTQWLDENGNVCCAIFNRWRGRRDVYVDRRDNGWFDGWWFAGVEKSAAVGK